MKKNIVLTGKPGIGKSTVIKRVIQTLDPERLGGFWSAEIRENNRRVGFSLITLSGEKGVLAHVDLNRGPRVGKYFVSIEDLEAIAIPALARARVRGQIIVIDEIASMELHSPRFAPEVRRCLDTGKVLATLQQRKGGFQDEVRTREDVFLIDVKLENRDILPQEVLSRLDGCNYPLRVRK
ncbi:MAG: NTPase [Candidatus Thorarchaeota archaeon]